LPKDYFLLLNEIIYSFDSVKLSISGGLFHR
jgi:hypothetical protein